MEERINNDTTLSGKSFILLLVPYSTSLTDEEKTFVGERKNVFKSYLPGKNSYFHFDDKFIF